MKLTLVRNATMMLEFDGARVLVDPMLGARGSLDPFPSATGDDSRDPSVDLTMPVSDLVGPDVVVVTHIHPEH